MFTKAVDDVRHAGAEQTKLPKALRWAKRSSTPTAGLADAQAEALAELETSAC